LKEEQVNQIKAILFLKKLEPDAFLTTWNKIEVKQDYEYLVPLFYSSFTESIFLWIKREGKKKVEAALSYLTGLLK